jgi:hypothetical protein
MNFTAQEYNTLLVCVKEMRLTPFLDVRAPMRVPFLILISL